MKASQEEGSGLSFAAFAELESVPGRYRRKITVWVRAWVCHGRPWPRSDWEIIASMMTGATPSSWRSEAMAGEALGRLCKEGRSGRSLSVISRMGTGRVWKGSMFVIPGR